ncbi:MAG: DUF4281 domain-containing protein [Gemmatimonadaceae bacterium]|nr:DUF4281 domain-containing protein [Gemmatimonadaceae bacterium]
MPSADALFAIVNPLPLPAWLLLLFVPRWKYTLPIARLLVVPLLAAAYAALVITKFGGTEGDFSSLAGVQLLFSNPHALLAGWVHYLAFDLFVGAWIVEDALARPVTWWARAIPLPLTLMFGPAGLLLYLVLRQFSSASVQPLARTGVSVGVGAA